MQRTVQDIINAIIAGVPEAPFPETIDTLKTGQAGQEVKSVVVTFMATYEVIEKAIELGADLIITHEPTFYGHTDEIDWLEHDPIYQAKRRLIDEHHIAIWRFHDYLHSLQPDPTLTGLLKALGWSAYTLSDQPFTCQLPPRSLHDLTLEIKAKLGGATLRVVGDPQMSCQRVGLLVGACGGNMHISGFSDWSLDTLVCGEINEWETNEYVRDALATGHAKALIVIGHSVSEEDGMREVIPWLQTRLPELPITFLPTGHALRSV